MIKITGPKLYKSVEEALVEANPQMIGLRKILMPETVKQPQSIVKSIDVVKYLGRKCGMNINARFPEDVVEFAKKHQKKMKYIKKNNYSSALEDFLKVFVARKRQVLSIDELLLDLKLRVEGKRILEKYNLKDIKFAKFWFKSK